MYVMSRKKDLGMFQFSARTWMNHLNERIPHYALVEGFEVVPLKMTVEINLN